MIDKIDVGALADVHELGTHGLFRLISTALGKRRNKLTSDDTWAIANEIYEAIAALRNSAPKETREPMDYGQELLRWSNIEIALRKKFPTLAATGTEIDGWPDLITALQETRGDEPVVSIKPMELSGNLIDYFVSIKVGDREVTPHVFREEYKAVYHVALYHWLLNGSGKEPDVVEFGPNDWPALALAPPPSNRHG